MGFRPPRALAINRKKWTDPKDVKIIRNAYLLLYIIIILCGTARAARTSVIKDSISKWNHFFIELSSYTDINYGARTLPQLARVSLFVLPFGMLYKSILFSNYMRRWTGNFNVNFAIIQCSDEINSRYRYEYERSLSRAFIFGNDLETFSRINYNE